MGKGHKGVQQGHRPILCRCLTPELQLWCQAAGGNTAQKQKLNSATKTAPCTRNLCLYEVSFLSSENGHKPWPRLKPKAVQAQSHPSPQGKTEVLSFIPAGHWLQGFSHHSLTHRFIFLIPCKAVLGESGTPPSVYLLRPLRPETPRKLPKPA